ncbi:MAG TPA: hypothetical protein VLT45_15580 [Kofleriaceae bacterium]|nr:hypothetical protein [Kofleriaceae bacterium]
MTATVLFGAGSALAQPAPAGDGAPPPGAGSGSGATEAPPPAPPPAPPVVAAPPPVVETAPPVAPTPPPAADDAAPTSFKIGNAYITPIGFMDFTGVWRSKAAGGGIGTNFGAIPYGPPNTELSENRFSMQNSRIGFRVDAPVKGAHVLGYMEADFLGNNPGNVAVSSNSNTLRSRLYFVDIKKGMLELLAGQSWSLITPSRSGISPLPGDIFFTQNVDVNYQAGLVWGRIPELRLAIHPSKQVSAAIAIDQAEQYIGGSAGGSTITLPGAYSSLAGTQLNNGTTTVNAPTFLPDVIAKVAVDPTKSIHVEAGGVERQFKIFAPNKDQTFSATGLGGFLNLNVGTPDIHLISNNFYSSGGGRYIFGQAPDLVVHADGTLSPITSWSTVDGIEATIQKKTLLFGYFSYIGIDKTVGDAVIGTTCMDAASCVGYGYAGSPSSQNKDIMEGTIGFNQTFWKDAKYGAVNVMGQYSYLSREPFSVGMGKPSNASLNMVFLNLRYTLPGAPPKLPD